MLPLFPNGHPKVLYHRVAIGQLIKMMVVRGKERFAPDLHKIFGYRPRNRETIVGAGAAPYLIENHEAAGGGVVQDVGRLAHLYHEGGLAAGKLIVCAHAGKDAVYDADGGRIGGHKAADLSQKNDQGGLAKVRGFAAHVGACNDKQPVLLVEVAIVGEVVASKADALYYGMASAENMDRVPIMHLRAHITV